MKPQKDEEEAVVLLEAKLRCRAVIEKTNALGPSSKISDSCKRTLLRLVNSELSFLSRIPSFTPSQALSVNIGYLEAVVYIIQQPSVTGASCVCKSIGNDKRRSAKGVHVDIMCTFNGRPVWFIVSDRNPKHVSWFASSRSKGLRERVKQLVDAAHSCSTLKPSSVIFFFASGINWEVQMKLKEEYEASEIGVGFSCNDFSLLEEGENDWVTVLARSFRTAITLEIKVDRITDAPVRVDHAKNGSISKGSLMSLKKLTMLPDPSDSFRRLLSSMEMLTTSWQDAEYIMPEDMSGMTFINFDTTALIAIVSGISNGGSEKLLSMPKEISVQRFKSNYDFVLAQIKSESERPFLLELTRTLSGKRGIICKSVFMEFKELVSMCGGEMENLRANELFGRLMIVPDNPSERVIGLPSTRKLALKSKIIFGTGDYWHSPTLTANMGFVRAVSQTEVTTMADFAANLQSLKLQYPFQDFDPNVEQLLAQFTQPDIDFQGFASSECSNETFFSQSQVTDFQYGNSFPAGVFPQSDEHQVLSASTKAKRVGEEGDCMKKRKTIEVSEGSSGISASIASAISAKNNRKGKKVKVFSRDKIPNDVVHVRARRGQATDSHSLAERVRRGKINERLKRLQDIVPGCYKTMGMAVMLDEITNYVQSLQNQVKFLSMRLTAASTFHDFSIEPEQIEESLQRAKVAELEKMIEDMNAGIACFQQQIWSQ